MSARERSFHVTQSRPPSHFGAAGRIGELLLWKARTRPPEHGHEEKLQHTSINTSRSRCKKKIGEKSLILSEKAQFKNEAGS